MATANNLRKLLHRKAWEMCTPLPVNTAAGGCIAAMDGYLLPGNDRTYYIGGASAVYNYNAEQDAWLLLPASGIGGTMGAGTCAEVISLGMLGGATFSPATAGTTTTVTTSRTLARSLAGCEFYVVDGAGVGYEGKVLSNTLGANAVITLDTASSVAFDSTTRFVVYSGSLWVLIAGTPGFGVYDWATNAWTIKSVTGLPAWGTCGQLVAVDNHDAGSESGTATAGGATTLTNGTANWLVNGYTNYQVRITAGTGAGQTRTIASNTATVLTVSSAWTVNPDATSVFTIEGNTDHLYLFGNNAVTAYRYTISTNTWATLSPGVARTAAMAGGGTADWINTVSDADWSGAQGKLLLQGGTQYKQNGRYIYSFQGGASGNLSVYDIAGNTWINHTTAYGNGGGETFTTGSSATEFAGNIYLTKESTGRMFRFDVGKHCLEPWNSNVYTQGTVIEGDKLAIVPYVDGATVIPFLYAMQHTRAELLRMMVIG